MVKFEKFIDFWLIGAYHDLCKSIMVTMKSGLRVTLLYWNENGIEKTGLKNGTEMDSEL